MVFKICKKINEAYYTEFIERLAIVTSEENTMSVPELKAVLDKYRGGKTRVYILYTRENAIAEIPLGLDWRMMITDDLISELKQLDGIADIELFH